MNSYLDLILEEDMELQDLIDGLNEGLYDDSDDIIIGVIEDRNADTSAHLFTNEATGSEKEFNDNIEELLDDEDDIDIDIEDLLDDDDFDF
jgi:hypothetical protein